MSIDINYFSFSPSRADKRWPDFVADISILRRRPISWKTYEKQLVESYGGKSDFNILNERQRLLELDRDAPIDYLTHENIFNRDFLLYDLKNLDIYYGSVRNEDFESPKIEWALQKAILEAFGLRKVNEYYSNDHSDYSPTRNEWIKIHQNINIDIIEEAINRLMKELQWDNVEWGKDSAKEAVISYLKSIKPVMGDLQETPDAVFISRTAGVTEVEPKSVNLLLMERAKKHTVKFKGALPPVL